MYLLCLADPVDDPLDSPSSCMSKGSRDPDLPKKRVTFDFYGKENLRQKTKLSDHPKVSDYSKLSDYSMEGLAAKYDLYAKELAKGRPELSKPRSHYTEQLLAAKDRPLDLRRLGLEAKYNTRNLLFFR
jgi:hypothetical protein